MLMPNHVHLILVPPDPDALRRCLAATHRRCAGLIHAREQRTGHFWQGRFGCVAMDEDHLAAAVRYVALNPVRARLVSRAIAQAGQARTEAGGERNTCTVTAIQSPPT